MDISFTHLKVRCNFYYMDKNVSDVHFEAGRRRLLTNQSASMG
jgi:hypothetical protein